MAFFGVQVEPGNPFTLHLPKARLHLSQATLGMGNGTQRSTLQCKVGNESPVFLCSLFPEKAECCQLHLEFDEIEQVIFSVLGPRSIHITGYYMPVFFSLSHLLNSICEHATAINLATGGQPERNEGNEKHVHGIDSNDLMFKEKREEVPKEERFPVADHINHGIIEIEPSEQNLKLATHECSDGNLQNNAFQASDQVVTQDSAKLNRKTEELVDEKTFKDEDKKEDEGLKGGSDFGTTNQDMIVEEKETQKQVNANDGNLPQDLLLSSAHVCLEDGADGSNHICKSEDRVKEESLKRSFAEDVEAQINGSNMGATIMEVHLEDNGTQSFVNSSQDNPKCYLTLTSTEMGFEDNHKRKRKREEEEVNDKTLEVAKEVEGQNVDDKQTEKNAMKRKKKKASRKKEVVKAIESKNADVKAIQLPNEFMVEELEVGESDGETASVGKKVRIQYTTKLIGESGEELDSVAKKTSKFQLGQEDVHEAWSVGLEGMRVGGKRKLTIPPSMSSASEGADDTSQPKVWHVYEVVLRRVK